MIGKAAREWDRKLVTILVRVDGELKSESTYHVRCRGRLNDGLAYGFFALFKDKTHLRCERDPQRKGRHKLYHIPLAYRAPSTSTRTRPPRRRPRGQPIAIAISPRSQLVVRGKLLWQHVTDIVPADEERARVPFLQRVHGGAVPGRAMRRRVE